MPPSLIDNSDHDSDFLPPLPTTPLIKYTTRSSLAVLPDRGASAVAGPCTLHGVEVIEVEGIFFYHCSVKFEWLNRLISDSESAPSARQGRTASPTVGSVENLDTSSSFSGSFYVDESLKALNPWEAGAADEAWEF